MHNHLMENVCLEATTKYWDSTVCAVFSLTRPTLTEFPLKSKWSMQKIQIWHIFICKNQEKHHTEDWNGSFWQYENKNKVFLSK